MRLIDLPRALLALAIAYVAVPTPGFAVYLVVAEVMEHSPWEEVAVRDNAAYQHVAVILPVLNLAVWTGAARWYFVGQHVRNSVWPLGLTWLIIAALVDYVVFVVPKHALALDHVSFYLDQGPWIYLTYLAVAVSPYLGCWWSARARSGGKRSEERRTPR